MKLAFITKFPDHVFVELLKLPNIHSIVMGEIISQVSEDDTFNSDCNIKKESKKEHQRRVEQATHAIFKGQCFRCQGSYMV